MQYVSCIVACCPLRKEASHKSEMVSQLLFCETAEIIESGKDFFKVKCLDDAYEGFVQSNQVTFIDNDFAMRKPVNYSDENDQVALINGSEMRLSLCTPMYENCFVGKYKIEFPALNKTRIDDKNFDEIEIKRITNKFLNTSYLWGGRSSFGMDCSGFTQQVFKMFGKKLLRDAYQQALQGKSVNSLEETICGDIAFFDNDEERIVHTGIVLDQNKIIHCSGKVRIDEIDVKGIISLDDGQRTHHLKIIKRL